MKMCLPGARQEGNPKSFWGIREKFLWEGGLWVEIDEWVSFLVTSAWAVSEEQRPARTTSIEHQVKSVVYEEKVGDKDNQVFRAQFFPACCYKLHYLPLFFTLHITFQHLFSQRWDLFGQWNEAEVMCLFCACLDSRTFPFLPKTLQLLKSPWQQHTWLAHCSQKADEGHVEENQINLARFNPSQSALSQPANPSAWTIAGLSFRVLLFFFLS